MGHCLGLYHTHETAFGREYVLRVNCTSAGDLICDTPADPNFNYSCSYNGNARDPIGMIYTPDPKNIMSYSTCTEFFSAGQEGRMRGMLLASNVLRNLQVYSSTLNLANQSISRGEKFEVAKNKIVALGTGVWEYAVSGSAKVRFKASEEIKLSLGFRATPGSTGSFEASLDQFYCAGASAFAEAISPLDSGDQEELSLQENRIALQGSTGLRAFPNPMASITTVEYTLEKASKIKLYIHNMMGQVIHQPVSNKEITAGVYQFQLDASALPSGMYFCVLEVDGKRYTKKLRK